MINYTEDEKEYLREYLEDPDNKDVVIPALQADSNYTLSVRKAKGT